MIKNTCGGASSTKPLSTWRSYQSSKLANIPGLLPFPYLLLLTFLLTFTLSAADFDTSYEDGVLRAVQACRAKTNPAMAVSVVKDGRVLLSRGYGVTRIGGNEAVTSTTRLNIASLSKAFAATLLLKVMHEDGRYNLSSKVRDVFGGEFELGDEFRTTEATVEDMLSHKMAIPANNRLRFNTNLTRANLKDRLKYLKTPDLFRNIYIYSNLMYGLATRMAEVIGGATWEDLIRRHLFEPLGMKRSTFVPDAVDDTSNFAPPYREYFQQLKPINPQLSINWAELAGSGSVVTTADDMAKWMTFHLTKGLSGQSRVMEEDLMEELYKPRTAMDKSTLSSFRRPDVPVTFTTDIYGMGFRQGYYRGYPILNHGGSSYGYRSLLTLVPSQNLGVFIVMTGGDSSYRTRGTVHAYLMDKALELTPWLNISTICSFPAPWRNITSKSWPPYDTAKPLTHPISAYPGLYHNPAYGTFEVRKWQKSKQGSMEDGQEPEAKLTLFYGFATWDLVPLSSSSSSSSSSPNQEQFYGKGRNVTAWVDYSPFVFHAPPAGSEVIVKMSAPGLERKSPPVFTRVGASTSRGTAVFLGGGLIWAMCALLALISEDVVF